jgi:hypothetical protein
MQILEGVYWMPISDTRKWRVNKSADEVQKIVTGVLASKRATLVENSPRRIEAKIGSEAKTRVLGGIFVSKETLPVKVTLQVNEVPGESEIYAVIEDNLGVGFRQGMVGKYKEYIQSLFNDLAIALQVKS